MAILLPLYLRWIVAQVLDGRREKARATWNTKRNWNLELD